MSHATFAVAVLVCVCFALSVYGAVYLRQYVQAEERRQANDGFATIASSYTGSGGLNVALRDTTVRGQSVPGGNVCPSH